jgi:hypothetical protein
MLQIFMRHVRTLPREEMKVLLGDSLAAHFSPYVLRTCEEWNIRYIFLPENSTHILQPLDVAVFAPMKREWRSILVEWKEQCAQENQVYATIPKSVFPSLLKKLLEKDYSNSIRSGFESCGYIPFNVQKVLAKLPQEDQEVESNVQRQLLQKLNSMRYNQPTQAQVTRPRKKDKLPAGASYTCLPGQQDEVCLPGEDEEEMAVQVLDRSLSESRKRREESDSESDAELIVAASRNSAGRQARRDFWGYEIEDDEEEDDKEGDDDEECVEESTGIEESVEESVQTEDIDDPEECQYHLYYPVGSYVVAVYQGAWYVGQVLEKTEEKLALPQDEYLYLSFMQRTEKSMDLFKWPEKPDKLNTLKEDILFACSAPTPSNATSSSRSITFSLTKAEIKKAYMLLNKAYYHTKFISPFFYFNFSNFIHGVTVQYGTGTVYVVCV